MSLHLMVDLETLGIEKGCPVMSIGVAFFSEGPEGVVDSEEIYLNVDEQLKAGRNANFKTILWWMGQKDAARDIFIKKAEKALPVKLALSRLQAYAEEMCKTYKITLKELKIWGNGSDFDISILESLYLSFGMTPFWNYRNVRDLRTFKDYVYDGSSTKNEGEAHRAVDDAIYQAQIVADGLRSKRR